MIEEIDKDRRIRITAELCVNELDVPKLAVMSPVFKRCTIGQERQKRQFVKLTPETATRIHAPMWADLITGTLYGMDGTSTSPQCRMG